MQLAANVIGRVVDSPVDDARRDNEGAGGTDAHLVRVEEVIAQVELVKGERDAKLRPVGRKIGRAEQGHGEVRAVGSIQMSEMRFGALRIGASRVDVQIEILLAHFERRALFAPALLLLHSFSAQTFEPGRRILAVPDESQRSFGRHFLTGCWGV